jgi:hypothetical protein
MIETIFVALFAAAVSSILSGAGGFWLATTRANTRLTMLEENSERCIASLADHTASVDHRLSVMLRIMIDLARKTPGFEFRTADLFELTSLEPTAFHRTHSGDKT